MRINVFSSILSIMHFSSRKSRIDNPCLRDDNQLLCDCITLFGDKFQEIPFKRLRGSLINIVDVELLRALQLLTLYFYNGYTSNFKKKKERTIDLFGNWHYRYVRLLESILSYTRGFNT